MVFCITLEQFYLLTYVHRFRFQKHKQGQLQKSLYREKTYKIDPKTEQNCKQSLHKFLTGKLT